MDAEERYDRQIPVLGVAGQEKMKNARVMIAGAGGLGTIVAVYLAAAGVGFLKVVDDDNVSPGNLNRQFLFDESDLGGKKAHIISRRIHEFNPHISIDPCEKRIDDDSKTALVDGIDIIVDAVDNFATRRCLNGLALKKGIPLVHGGLDGFNGQVLTVLPGRSACLDCFFAGVSNVRESSAVGVTCGVVGSIQATEVIKYIAGRGDLLVDRLLIWNGLAGDVDILSVKRDPSCPSCGNNSDKLGR